MGAGPETSRSPVSVSRSTAYSVYSIAGRGVPFALLAQIMGWSASSTVNTAKRYGHVGDDSLRQAMAVLHQKPTPNAMPQIVFVGGDGESMTEKSPDRREVA
jgi:hypothetical protein